MNYIEKVDFIIEKMEEKSLENIYAADITKITSEANAFIIASANSQRQAKAVSEFIMEKCEEILMFPIGKEGLDNASWILLDYGDVVVHIFLEEERKFYALENLWQDAKMIKGGF